MAEPGGLLADLRTGQRLPLHSVHHSDRAADPFTKSLIGTILGADAALPALIVGAAPFYARLVEIALREVDKGVIEAARSMGAKTAP